MGFCLETLPNGYTLRQDDALFKLGTDAVLLSAFARPAPGTRVCDLGCGNGAVMIMMCARYPEILADGVEIQPCSHELALQNIAENHLSHRARAFCADLCTLGNQLPAGGYRTVVANPPYRRLGSGIGCADIRRETALAEVRCTIADVCRAAAGLLCWGGQFCVVYRPDRLCDLLCAMREAGVEPKRLRTFAASETAAASLVLVQGVRGGKPGMELQPPLIAGSPEFQRIYAMEPM